MTTIKVKRMSDTAVIPTRATEYSAGLDLYSDQNVQIIPRGRITITTNIAIEIPNGAFGWVVGRSGMSKRGLSVASGIVDSDYRGAIGVTIYNQTGDSLVIEKGQRIAQLIIQNYFPVEPVESAVLSETERGEKGFGSSGK